ncbi:hypothetical protein [Thermocoleostomius sinensis]|uniref:Uncharacterized protein n=1 Tax=Thermocoleostomius sinensis A174 TaxID=2016057 RepID=A0A9E8ZGC7_9CYAN|nr:hypothetical protein [Thermocoleostomius sinensis]WAL62638.1 hypothetical protein OXH18_11795 [Thermocoleostomius sinensis A174]
MRTVERIDQELARLNQSVTAIAQEFYDTYQQYLTALGQAVQQQLVVASYHLCTHAYPERFLKLSLSQRQQLQQALRQLAKAAQPQLLQLLHAAYTPATSRSSSIASTAASLLDTTDLAILQEIDEEVAREIERAHQQSAPPINPDESEATTIDTSTEATLSSSDSLPDWLKAIEALRSAPTEATSDSHFDPDADQAPPLECNLETQSDSLVPPPNAAESSKTEDTIEPSASPDQKPILPAHPKDLLQWQEHLEAGIIDLLQTLSHGANRLLQQSEVLSGHLPEPVLEVASKADIAAETTVSPPNLLHLLIETDGEEEKEPTMTQLMAIRLRLSEIEFSDSATTIWRAKIRDLSNQLHKLGRDYHKKQKERSIAEAEAAWRSSWFED